MPTIANARGRIKPDMSIVCRARAAIGRFP
jgi:hypothetical protein